MRTHEKLSVEAWRAQHAFLIYVVDYTLFFYPFFAVLITCYLLTSSGLRMFFFFFPFPSFLWLFLWFHLTYSFFFLWLLYCLIIITT